MFDFGKYYEPRSAREAAKLLAELAASDQNPAVICGGTDVLIKLRERHRYVGAALVSVRGIPELRGVRAAENGDIFIGAATSFTEAENSDIIKKCLPALAAGAASVGGPQTRNMGTLGGNVCNGVTSADTAGAHFAYNSKLIIQGPDGRREVEIASFYKSAGVVNLAQDELLVGFRIAKADYEGFRGHYIKFAQRRAMDIATLGCSVNIKAEGGVIADLRVAFGVAGPVPMRAMPAEEYAAGKPISDEVLANIGEECVKCTKSRDSWRASKAFREQLIRTLPGRAIKTALVRG